MMKPVTIILTLMLLVGLSATAAPKVTADVTMNNGTEYKSVTFDKLPKGWDDEVKLVINGEKVKLKSDSINYIVLWHDEAPQRQCLIKYCAIGKYEPDKNKISEAKDKWWFSLESAGDNLQYWIRWQALKPSKKSMKMEIVDYPHFFQKRGTDVPVNIPSNYYRPGKTRDWLRAYLADDQVLCNDLTDKGYFNRKNQNRQGNIYNPFFYEEIAVDYTPGRTE